MAQIANTAGGHLAGGDVIQTVNLHPTVPSPMAELVKKYKNQVAEDETLAHLVAKLQHYFSVKSALDVRDLQSKLTSSDRGDLLASALEKKQAASKLIMRYQSSLAGQAILAYVLAEMIVAFELKITPLIQANEPRTVVDGATLDHVISPCIAALGENPLGLDALDVQSLLYFLGGNCHVTFVDQVVDAHQAKAQQTLLMVRTIRNNLFHGGKYLPNGEHEAGRNEKLVSYSLMVLKYCTALNEQVLQRYEY